MKRKGYNYHHHESLKHHFLLLTNYSRSNIFSFFFFEIKLVNIYLINSLYFTLSVI